MNTCCSTQMLNPSRFVTNCYWTVMFDWSVCLCMWHFLHWVNKSVYLWNVCRCQFCILAGFSMVKKHQRVNCFLDAFSKGKSFQTGQLVLCPLTLLPWAVNYQERFSPVLPIRRTAHLWAASYLAWSSQVTTVEMGTLYHSEREHFSFSATPRCDVSFGSKVQTAQFSTSSQAISTCAQSDSCSVWHSWSVKNSCFCVVCASCVWTTHMCNSSITLNSVTVYLLARMHIVLLPSRVLQLETSTLRFISKRFGSVTSAPRSLRIALHFRDTWPFMQPNMPTNAKCAHVRTSGLRIWRNMLQLPMKVTCFLVRHAPTKTNLNVLWSNTPWCTRSLLWNANGAQKLFDGALNSLLTTIIAGRVCDMCEAFLFVLRLLRYSCSCAMCCVFTYAGLLSVCNHYRFLLLHLNTYMYLLWFFQMPGLLAVNNILPAFPNAWLYNTEHFTNAALAVKLQMSQKLVVTAKKSVFFVMANGPREGEEIVAWKVQVCNVEKRLALHKEARSLVEKEMYAACDSFNGHID